MDDVLLNKAEIIARCLARIEEEYKGHEDELAVNYTRQDAIVLNVQRACEAAIDAGMHLVRVRRLGLPQQSRDAFRFLEQAGLLDGDLADAMCAMVGFRNVAVHQYQELNLDVLRFVLEHRLDDFRRLIRLLRVQAGEAG